MSRCPCLLPREHHGDSPVQNSPFTRQRGHLSAPRGPRSSPKSPHWLFSSPDHQTVGRTHPTWHWLPTNACCLGLLSRMPQGVYESCSLWLQYSSRKTAHLTSIHSLLLPAFPFCIKCNTDHIQRLTWSPGIWAPWHRFFLPWHSPRAQTLPGAEGAFHKNLLQKSLIFLRTSREEISTELPRLSDVFTSNREKQTTTLSSKISTERQFFQIEFI